MCSRNCGCFGKTKKSCDSNLEWLDWSDDETIISKYRGTFCKEKIKKSNDKNVILMQKNWEEKLDLFNIQRKYAEMIILYRDLPLQLQRWTFFFFFCYLRMK